MIKLRKRPDPVEVEAEVEVMNVAVELLDVVYEHGDRYGLAYVDELDVIERLRFVDIAVEAARWAALLRGHGIQPGERVVVVAERNKEWRCALLGVLQAGGVAVPCPAQTPAAELRAIAAHAGAKFFVSARARPDLVQLDGVPVLSADKLDVARAAPPLAYKTMPDDIALILYARDAAGLHGAMHTHASLVAQAKAGEHWLGVRADERVWCTAADGSVESIWLMLAAWREGAEIVAVDHALDPEAQLVLLDRFQAAAVWFSDDEYGMLASAPAPAWVDLGSIRRALTSQERASGAIAFQHAFGAKVAPVYGSKETGAVAGCPFGREDEAAPGTCFPFPSVQLAIVDEHGNELGAGQLGDVAVRGDTPTLFMGYDDGRGAAPTPTEWFRVGERGTVDADGSLRLASGALVLIKPAGAAAPDQLPTSAAAVALATPEAPRRGTAREAKRAEREADEQTERDRLAAEAAAREAEEERKRAEQQAKEDQKAEKRRLAEEADRAKREAAEQAERDRLAAAASAREAEQERKRAEQQAKEDQKAEKLRLAEEAKNNKLEERRLAEEAKRAEQQAKEDAKAEKLRLAEEAKNNKLEERRLAEEAKRAEREAAEQAEQERKRAEQQAKEDAKAEKLRLAEEAKNNKLEERRLAEEAKRAEREAAEQAEQERKRAEQQAKEDAKAEKLRRAEEAKNNKLEERRLAEEAKRAEQQAKEDEKAEKLRRVEEAKNNKLEERRLAEEAKRAEREAAEQAEQERKRAEQQAKEDQKAEKLRLAEEAKNNKLEQRRLAEEAKRAEREAAEQAERDRLAAEAGARQAEQERKRAEQAERERLAAEATARQAEERRQRDEAKNRKLAERAAEKERRLAEETQRAEERRRAKEKGRAADKTRHDEEQRRESADQAERERLAPDILSRISQYGVTPRPVDPDKPPDAKEPSEPPAAAKRDEHRDGE